MTDKEFLEARDYLFNLADQIQKKKRPAYTVADSDVLKNFKSVAERLKLPNPGIACMVYAEKHQDAIRAWFLNPATPQAEDLEGRFADELNYLVLKFACYRELKMQGYDKAQSVYSEGALRDSMKGRCSA